MHPNIKNPRIYARNVIRETTGEGIFDDYIFRHKLWRLRNPILAPPDLHEKLKNKWELLAKEGRELIEMDEMVKEAIDKGDETTKLLLYAMGRVHDTSKGR